MISSDLVLCWSRTVIFMMTHSIDIATAQLGSKRVFDQLFWYPFDFYHSGADFFALNANDNTSLPIILAVFAEPVNNFAPQSTETATQSLVNGTLVQSRNTVLGLRRTVNAKMYTFLLFIVNWALTLLVAYITMLVHVGEKLGEGIVVLPLTIILTMPTIRGLFVEDPPFGACFPPPFRSCSLKSTFVFLQTLGILLGMALELHIIHGVRLLTSTNVPRQPRPCTPDDHSLCMQRAHPDSKHFHQVLQLCFDKGVLKPLVLSDRLTYDFMSFFASYVTHTPSITVS